MQKRKERVQRNRELDEAEMKRLFQVYEKSGMARKDLEELRAAGREEEDASLLEGLPQDEFPESLDHGEKRDTMIRAMQERLAENERKRAAARRAEKRPAWYRRPAAARLAVCACVLVLAVTSVSVYTYTLHGHASPGRQGLGIQNTSDDFVIGADSSRHVQDIQVGNIPDGYSCVLEESFHKTYQKGSKTFDIYWGDADAISAHMPESADDRRFLSLQDDSDNPVLFVLDKGKYYVNYAKDGEVHFLLISSGLTEKEMVSVISSISFLDP